MKERRWLHEEHQSPAFFIFIFIFIMCFVLLNYWEQRQRAAVAMVKKEPHPLSFIHPGTREKTIHPSLSGLRQTAHQPRKIRNQAPTKGAEQENQINTWGGSNRDTLAVDTNNEINNSYNQ